MVTRSRKSKRDRQYTGQKKRDRQYTGQKKRDRQYTGQKKRDRQYTGQKKRDKTTNNNVQNTTREVKVQATRTPLKPGCC